MNTQMFLKITENIAELNTLSKDRLIISGIGILPKDIKEYFKNTLIKRSRAIVDIKKNIAKTILEVHNKKYQRNKDLCYSLTEIANVLDIKSHASVLAYFKNEKLEDELSLFVKENYIRWINEKKHPIPSKKGEQKDFYVLIKENEFENLKLNNSRRIKLEDFYQLINIKNREHFIGS